MTDAVESSKRELVTARVHIQILQYYYYNIMVKLFHSKNIRRSQLKSYNHKQLLISSAITLGILCPSNVISQPLTKTKLYEVNKFSNESFITNAVEKTGSSVVTIETQRYVKKRKFTRNSQIFLLKVLS